MKSEKYQDAGRNVDSETGPLGFGGGIRALLGTGQGVIHVTSGKASGCVLPVS